MNQLIQQLEGTIVAGSEGIVDEDVDRSIAYLGQLASIGMIQRDGQILQIRLHKS